MGAAGAAETEGQTLIGLECKTAAFAWGRNVRVWLQSGSVSRDGRGGSALTGSVEQ